MLLYYILLLYTFIPPVPCFTRDPDQFQTTSNKAYNVVRGTGGVGGGESEYEVPQVFPTTTAAENCL